MQSAGHARSDEQTASRRRISLHHLEAGGFTRNKLQAIKRCTVSTKMRVSATSSAPSRARRRRHANGNVSTHCRSATRGSTRSTRLAAVSHIRRPMHDGQNPRPLHENATSRDSSHEPHRSRYGHCVCGASVQAEVAPSSERFGEVQCVAYPAR